MMDVDEPLYSIFLNREEVRYLCEALERGFQVAHQDHDVAVWVMRTGSELQVTLNETGYDLVSHLKFGMHQSKMWARIDE